MTSYASPQGLLSDQYAGAFSPRQGLLADPAMMMQVMQKAQSMGLLDGMGGRNMGNDAVQMPPVDPAMAGQPMGPLSEAPMGPGGFAQTPGGKPGTMGGAGTQPGQPSGPGPMPANMTPEQFAQAQATAKGMMAGKPGGTMGGAATQAGQPGGPGFPGRQIPSGYAMPIAPRASLDSIYGMYAPAASAEGKLPPMGLGGLRRMYASPETLAAEAETAKAVEAAPAPVYVPANESGGGDGAAAEGTSNAEGYRRGGMIPSDGDGKLEARKATLHEGEMVMNPEATSLLGPDRLNEINRMALRKKRRGLLDD